MRIHVFPHQVSTSFLFTLPESQVFVSIEMWLAHHFPLWLCLCCLLIPVWHTLFWFNFTDSITYLFRNPAHMLDWQTSHRPVLYTSHLIMHLLGVMVCVCVQALENDLFCLTKIVLSLSCGAQKPLRAIDTWRQGWGCQMQRLHDRPAQC